MVAYMTLGANFVTASLELGSIYEVVSFRELQKVPVWL